MSKSKKKWVVQYRDNCIGCGACEIACPKYWKMNNEDGKSDLIDGEEKNGVHRRKLDSEDYDANKLAADSCPVGIIKVD